MMKMGARQAAPLAVLALGFAFAACGAAPQEELLPISSTEAAQANTTRDVCTACGCVATDAACDCGTPPGREKLDCIDNGGAVNGGGAAGPDGARASAPGLALPQLKIPDPPQNPYCPAGQVMHCTVGPLPFCWCVPITSR